MLRTMLKAMFRSSGPFIAAAACILVIVACDNGPDLERTVARERAVIEAEFFTENPENIQFPVKVLFAIDCSNSMNESDPPDPPDAPYGRRIAAVRRFINEYNTSEYPNVSFNITLWSGNVMHETEDGFGNAGFTRSTEELDRVLDSSSNETYTDYIGTLDAIHSTLENDIITSERADGSGANQTARTKYIVLFFSDGMPNVPGEAPQTLGQINDQVDALNELMADRGVGNFRLHTFFLRTWFELNPGNDQYEDYAASVLREMARRGNGAFITFGNSTDGSTHNEIDFLEFTDMRLTNSYRVKYVIAYNYMVLPGRDVLHLDSDGDGMSDREEEIHNTDPSNRDTDNDGLSDFIELDIQSLGDDGVIWPEPLVDDSGCTPTSLGIYPDQDSDGMTDCEEWRKGTWRFVADFDADYMPDGIEVVARTNVRENLYADDSDMDGTLDIFEVRNHTNANISNDDIVRNRYSYEYDLRDHGNPDPRDHPDLPQGLRRYTVNVSNISLMDTLGAAPSPIFNGGHELQPGDNVIRLYIAQVPEDTPTARPIFRMAEVVINTLRDDTYRIELNRDQFELID